MATVVIEGTHTPAAGVLGRGERKTVRYTDRIARLVENGFIRIVGGDPVDDTTEPEADSAAQPTPETDTPAGNATTEEWVAFLRGKNVDIPSTETGETPGREELKVLWAKHQSGA
ncbi:MAG: hypothetical protein JOY78_00210 [Pseudonocardia sp.]|nr:hypothetical protein [Pseudonocardia sp.]